MKPRSLGFCLIIKHNKTGDRKVIEGNFEVIEGDSEEKTFKLRTEKGPVGGEHMQRS
jgi:hypothetical protein